MKFSETAIYMVLSIPGEEWEKDCGYVFALKVPVLVWMMAFGIPLAIVVDIVKASLGVGRGA